MPDAQAGGGIRRAFANNPNYRLYFAGNAVSLVGTWMQRTGVGALAWELTHSAAYLGLIAMAEFLPSLLLGPLAGAVADRISRLAIIAAMQGLLCVQALLLAGLTLGGQIAPLSLFLLTLLLGFATAAVQPARLSVLPALVRREDIPSAVAVNSIGWNLARFIGPALAAPVLVHLGAGWTFLFNAASFGAFLAVLPLLRLQPAARAASAGRGLFREIGDGFVYVARHAGIGPLVALLLAAALLVRPYVELLPAFADVVFDRGAEGFSMLVAANGLGAIVGGLWLGRRGGRRGLAAVVFAGAAAHAGLVALFALVGSFAVALAALAAAGFAMVVMGVGAQSLIQTGAPPEMLGRVLGVYGLSFRAGPALGALAMGGLADIVGLAWPVLGGAALCLLVWALLRARLPAIRAALEPER